MRKTRKLALSSLITAFAVVLCWVAAVMPSGSVALVGIAGLLTAIVVVECGYSWALGKFAATIMLVLLLVPDRMIVLMYAGIFGWYPVIKSLLERGKLRSAAQWAIKVLILNAALVLGYIAASNLFILAGEPNTRLLLIVLLPAEVAFVLYDIVLTRLIDMYIQRRAKK
ncbi:MAG: hypothetical protein LBD85_07225 [Oscillospiraceae bacterium]|nr:hypothetical protein [Oscillospiraceae bacterium]